MLPDMKSKTTVSLQKLQQRIDGLKSQIRELGTMRPGSISRQYNVCGKPGCRCKDPKNPRRHGPYYQLNYVYGGKKTSEFVRPLHLKPVRTQLANYKQFRRLADQWIGLALKLARLELEK
jgi:hypothetical protein